MQVVEEVLLLEKVMSSSFQTLPCCRVRGHKTDIVDGADVEHRGRET